MRKMTMIGGALGLLVLSTGVGVADDMPMPAHANMAPHAAQKPAAQDGAHKPAAGAPAHKPAADASVQKMHDQMMKDHQQGMATMPNAPASDAAAKPPMKGCCGDDAMMPKDGAMPKPKDGAMPMKHM